MIKSKLIKSGYQKDYILVIKEIDSNSVLCTCKCGKAITRSKKYLAGAMGQKQFNSCGCQKQRNTKGKNSCRWRGYEDISGTYWKDLQYGAIRRKLFWNITIEQIWVLYLKQDKKCALSDLPINFDKGNKQTASLDRIDSSKGYEEGNLQWTHKHINESKSDLNNDEYIKWCKLIAQHRNLR